MPKTEPAISDREARAVVERVVALWDDGDSYGAYDEINQVHGRGFKEGRKPVKLTLDEQIEDAKETLAAAEEDVARQESVLRELRDKRPIRLVIDGNP